MDAMVIGGGRAGGRCRALSLAAQGAAWAMYGVAAGLLAGVRLVRGAAALVAGLSPQRRPPASARGPAPR